MIFSEDMKELLVLFEKHQVKYLIVGGFAVNFYGYVRMTQDVDFLLFPSEDNATKIMDTLKEFGFGEAGIPKEYFTKEGTAIHLGVEPNRIDLLTHIEGVDNGTLFDNMEIVEYGGVSVNIISKLDLIKSKKKSERLKDLADAEELEKTDNA